MEKYVLMHSGCYEKIFGDKMANADQEDLEGLVKIKNGCKTVYRRYKSSSINGETIQMGYRTRKELGVDDGEMVSVSATNWFCYLWNNQDSCVKHPFRIAFIGIILAIISFFITLLGLLVSMVSLCATLVDGLVCQC